MLTKSMLSFIKKKFQTQNKEKIISSKVNPVFDPNNNGNILVQKIDKEIVSEKVNPFFDPNNNDNILNLNTTLHSDKNLDLDNNNTFPDSNVDVIEKAIIN